LTSIEEVMLAGAGPDREQLQLWQRVLYWLRMYIPPGGGPFLNLLEEQVGPGTAFHFARTQFFAQRLWALALFAILWIIVAPEPPENGEIGFQRTKWEVCKLLLLGWGTWVAAGRQRLTRGMRNKYRRQATPNPAYDPSQKNHKRTQLLKLSFVAVPVLVVFTLAVNMTVVGITQLIAVETFVWGDCMKLGCVDPVEKHGFVGWLVEVGTDVVLVLLFELFFVLARLLAGWLASLRNYKEKNTLKMATEVLILVLASVERVSTFGVLAFVFAPQWERPPSGDEVDMSRPCNDLWFGSVSLFCLQRRLPTRTRRIVLRRLLNGPFVTAPFIAIIVKVILPKVADWLYALSRRTGANCWRPLKAVADFITRTLACIFAFEHDAVGGPRFLWSGWPFSDLSNIRGAHWEEVKLDATAPWEEPTLCVQASIRTNFSAAEAAAKGAATLADALAHFGPPPIHLAWHDMPFGGEAANDEPEQAGETPTLDVTGQDNSREALIDRGLEEGVRKPFEPACELMEAEMTFLWIMLFAPILPRGVIPTMLAHVVEIKSDLTKLLFVRRRPFPEPALVVRTVDRAFIRSAVFGAVGWSAGLSVITYNDNLWRWHWAERAAAAVGVGLWLVVSAAIAMAHADRAWLAVVLAVGAILALLFVMASAFTNDT